jgi:hypothetical protein
LTNLEKYAIIVARRLEDGFSHGAVVVLCLPCRSPEARRARWLLPGAGKYTKKKILKTSKRSHQLIENKEKWPEN